MPESENEIPEEHKIIDRFKRKSKRLKNAAFGVLIPSRTSVS
jgi:hypothetical protein